MHENYLSSKEVVIIFILKILSFVCSENVYIIRKVREYYTNNDNAEKKTSKSIKKQK